MFGERMSNAVGRRDPLRLSGSIHISTGLPRVFRQRYEGLSGKAFRETAADAVVQFNRVVIDAIAGLVPAVKPQFAFYEELGAPGFAALEETCSMARQAGLLVLGDAKRGDIASTASAYARSITVTGWPILL